MNMIIPNVGLELWLYWLLNQNSETLEDFVVDLYQNNYTPVFTSVAANFTASTFPGYAQVSVTRSSFTTISAADGIGAAVSTITPQWTCNGGAGQDAYGWFMRGATSGTLLAAQEFLNVRNMLPNTTETLGPFAMQMSQFS